MLTSLRRSFTLATPCDEDTILTFCYVFGHNLSHLSLDTAAMTTYKR